MNGSSRAGVGWDGAGQEWDGMWRGRVGLGQQWGRELEQRPGGGGGGRSGKVMVHYKTNKINISLILCYFLVFLV